MIFIYLYLQNTKDTYKMTDKTKHLLIVLLLAIPLLAEAQTIRNHGIKATILGAEYYHELAFAKVFTFMLHGGVASEIMYSKLSLIVNDEKIIDDSEWAYSLRFTAGADLRYYYNLKKRARKGRNTRKNSGGYLGIGVQYFSSGIIENNMHTHSIIKIYPNWGFRRVYKRNWFIDINMGFVHWRESEYIWNNLGYSISFGKAF